MIKTSQRSIYGLDLQSHMLLGEPYTPLLNTTLNEKFGINTGVDTGSVYPTIKYLAIGVGGSSVIDESSLKHSKHTAIDAALFEHVPFVLKTVATDLVPSERLKYRLRKAISINGVDYIAYYIKTITSTTMKKNLFEINTNDGTSSLGFFDTNRNDLLEPIPRVVSNYLDPNNSTYIARTIKFLFELTVSELTDINAAINIIYGTNKNLTEIGICTGVDQTIGDVTEAVNVQINYFVDVDLDMLESITDDKSIVRNIEIGGMEPMIL